MLIEFKVANFQCFRDEVTLNLRPSGKDPMLQGNIWEGHRHRALKTVAIFGPNASGKTSLLHALGVFSRFVGHSATSMNVGDPIKGVVPFRLSKETLNKPTGFEVLVELERVGYRYRIEVTREHVIRERLERQDSAKGANWLTLIDRDRLSERCILHAQLGTDAKRRQIVEDTRPNALILSRAAERNVDSVEPLFNWFRRRVKYIDAGTGSPPDVLHLEPLARQVADDHGLLEQLSEFIRDADTGIQSIQIEPYVIGDNFMIEIPDDLSSEQKSAISDLKDAIKRLTKHDVEKAEEHERSGYRLFTEHAASGIGSVRFRLDDESSGTIRYLRFAWLLLHHCRSANLIGVDELHTSLHPLLARRVVQMAHSSQFGQSGTQMIFTTHDTTFLDPNLLRRDQIVLTQKDADGAAEVYSLWDYEHMPRNTAAWERNYLAGRFGGVPVFGPKLEEIPQDEEPTFIQHSECNMVED